MILETDYWTTPNEVVGGIKNFLLMAGEILHDHYAVDVCANEFNTKVPYNFITEEMNAFKTEWGYDCLAWCNPPYSRGNVDLFINRALNQWCYNGVQTIMLLNCDNSTQWFSQVVKRAKAVVFITEGRIRFIDTNTGKEGANPSKPNMFVLFGDRAETGLNTYYLTKEELYAWGNK